MGPRDRTASNAVATARHQRHQPEKTLLYQIVEQLIGSRRIGHMLFLDGVYIDAPKTKFKPVMVPTHEELVQLVHTVSYRIARFLERRGLLVRDTENAYLDLLPEDEGPMDTLMGHSITYFIATGPNAGRKVFTSQTLPAIEDEGGLAMLAPVRRSGP